MLIFVVDIVVTTSNEKFVENVIENIKKEFAIRKLGVLRCFLGIQVKNNSNQVHFY